MEYANLLSGVHKSSQVEYTTLVKWSIQIQYSGVHKSVKVEYTNLAVERLWPVRNNKLKSRNLVLPGYNQMAPS